MRNLITSRIYDDDMFVQNACNIFSLSRTTLNKDKITNIVIVKPVNTGHHT